MNIQINRELMLKDTLLYNIYFRTELIQMMYLYNAFQLRHFSQPRFVMICLMYVSIRFLLNEGAIHCPLGMQPELLKSMADMWAPLRSRHVAFHVSPRPDRIQLHDELLWKKSCTC